jgi:hypothetical protein
MTKGPQKGPFSFTFFLDRFLILRSWQLTTQHRPVSFFNDSSDRERVKQLYVSVFWLANTYHRFAVMSDTSTSAKGRWHLSASATLRLMAASLWSAICGS